MSIDLATAAGVLRFCALRRAEMARDFERVGRFQVNGYAYVGFVFATCELVDAKNGGRSGAKLSAVTALPVALPALIRDAMDWTKHTEFFGYLVREYAKHTRALGVVILSEAWMAPESSLPADGYQYGWIEKQPARREALFMQLEHKAVGRTSWMALILREPTRLEPWKQSDRASSTADDNTRLANLVDWKS